MYQRNQFRSNAFTILIYIARSTELRLSREIVSKKNAKDLLLEAKELNDNSWYINLRHERGTATKRAQIGNKLIKIIHHKT